MMNFARTSTQAETGAAVPVARLPVARAFVRLRIVSIIAAGATLIALLGNAHAAQAPDSFADLAAKVTPAVVNVSSKHKVARTDNPAPDVPFDVPKGSPFEEFFKHFREKQGENGGRPVTALGSGFIIDPSGYVVTNNHVIDGASDIEVTLSNGKDFPAKLIGTDQKTDLALLKIDSPTPLPAVPFGDSDGIRVGDWVMAVGNPFGLGGTVTAGIISARGRDLHSGPYDDFLQVDASINQGNSGGPTFDMAGEVIGINTAIASPNGGSVGIGFAIPANEAKPVIAALREHGSIERGWLGVQIQEVTPDIAQATGLDKAEGALVADIQPNSPAAKSDLKRGDVIVGYDGKPVKELRDLTRLVADTPVGQNATLTIWRDGTKQSVSVQIAKLQPDQEAAASPNDENSGGNDNGDNGSGSGDVAGQPAAALGLTLSRITPDVRQQFEIPDSVKGVVVTDVDAGGPAAAQGIQPGDVIEQVAQKDVSTPREVQSLAQEARAAHRNAVLLLVNRQGNELYVAVKFA
jgi:serine protease Do